jgi:murein DD-endopeptidase MepM/ murein hydrolase activator NlpD
MHPVYAQSSRIDELKQSITDKTNEIQNIEAEIAAYQKQLESVGGQKKTLQTEIRALDITRAKLAKDIELTQKKIDRTNLGISDITKQIKRKENNIDQNKQVIASVIRQIDEAEGDSLLEVFLSNSSIADFFENIDTLSSFQSGIGDHIHALQSLKQELGNEKLSYEAEQKKLLALNNQIGDQKFMADQERKSQIQLLSETKNKESNYKKILDDKVARKKQFEREVDDFEAQLRAEIDPNSFPKPGSHVLQYPVDNPLVTQKFGKTVDARRLYVSGTHNGTDFRATMGTPIKAAADGVVLGIGDTDQACRYASYGKWVLIKHKNGLSSLYGHLSLIKVNPGDNLSAGDLVGYSGNTGYSTGPHLHFTVIVSSAVQIDNLPSKSCPGAVFRIPVAAQNAYLDPEAYF